MELQVFENSEFGKVRTVMLDGIPWLVGRDVAKALGYAKPENAIAIHVESDDKTTTLIRGSGSNYTSKTLIINESGVNMSAAFYTRRRKRFTVEAEKFDTCGGRIGQCRRRRFIGA